MTGSGIRITRVPYEEPYCLDLRVEASNGQVCGGLEVYCSPEDVRKLGAELSDYSGRRGSEVVYEIGSERPEERFAYFFSLRVGAVDSRGHCYVSVRFNNRRELPDREVVEFSIVAETADVNRLGGLLSEFGWLRHRLLVWRVTTGDLYVNEDDEEAAAR